MKSKQDEIALFRAFIDSLPADSYLADLFADTIGPVTNHIETDAGKYFSFRQCWQDLTDANRETIAARKTLREIQAATKQAEEQLNTLKTHLVVYKNRLKVTRERSPLKMLCVNSKQH